MRAAPAKLLFLLAASLTFLISWGALAQEPTLTPEPTWTPTATETATLLPPLPPTDLPTATQTETPTIPPPPTPSETATANATNTETVTPSPLFTETATDTATASPTFDPLATLTETLTATMTGTASATASATETGTGTITPTVTATETASATPTGIPGLTLISFTDVEQLHVADWLDDGTWNPVWNEQGKMLEILPMPLPGYFIYPGLGDVAVQARFFAPNGALSLTVRDSGTDNYTATVYPTTGQVQLLRNRTLIQSITLNITPGAWHTFQLSAVGSLIKVTLDGTDILLFSDTQPLVAGMVGLMNADSAQSLLVDDLAVWAGGIAAGALDMSMSEMAMSVQSVTPTPVPLPPLPARVGYRVQYEDSMSFFVLEPNRSQREFRPGGNPAVSAVDFSITGDRIAYSDRDTLVLGTVPNDGQQNEWTNSKVLFGYPLWTGASCPDWSAGENYVLARLRGSGNGTTPLPGGGQNITTTGLYLVTPRNPGDTLPPVLSLAVPASSSDNSLFCGVWSHAQDRFVTTRRINNENDLWLYDVTNLANPVRLTANLRGESYVTWSPDGTKIAYVAPANGSSNIYVIDLNQPGSLPHVDPPALRGTQVTESEPSWSPDSSQIAYYRSAQLDDPDNGVWVVSLANPAGAYHLESTTTANRSPQWSPSNRWIAYQGTVVVSGSSRYGYRMFDMSMGVDYPIIASPSGNIAEFTWANVPPVVQAGTLVAPTRTSTPTVTPLPTQVAQGPTPTPTTIPPTPAHTGRGLNCGNPPATEYLGVNPEYVSVSLTPTPLPSPTRTRLTAVSCVSFDWERDSPIQGIPIDNFGVNFEAWLNPQTTDVHKFFVITEGYTYLRVEDAGGTVIASVLNDQEYISGNALPPTTLFSGEAFLKMTDCYKFSLAFVNSAGDASVELQWSIIVNGVANPPTMIPSDSLYQSRTDCEERTPRDVAPEAEQLHDLASRFGLPQPFDILPVAFDPALEEDFSWQGYGATTYAFFDTLKREVEQEYDGTHFIHPGQDYGGSDLDIESYVGRNVLALCDGVIWVGRNATGGSMSPGYGNGLSLRCFADDATIYDNVDNDNNRNLSNIIVTYNHLVSRNYLPHDPVANGNNYVIVTQGTVLGTLGRIEELTYPHLHLEVFIADAPYNFGSNDAVRINPLLLYQRDIFIQHFTWLQSYYPFNGPISWEDSRRYQDSLPEACASDDVFENAGQLCGNSPRIFGINGSGAFSLNPTFIEADTVGGSGSFWSAQNSAAPGVELPSHLYGYGVNGQRLHTYLESLIPASTTYDGPECVNVPENFVLVAGVLCDLGNP
jgi:dipeptidyl aminopeptidase/acylaminoacyl peptidase/murein DD-endopeptidase MepM/ murein hydrolase activator NlpD